MEEIIRFQQNMLLIRRAVGWTAEEFGDLIGVTRQTINNLEKNNRDKFKLNKTQYIAMRSVLDAEIAQSPEETETLQLILEMLVDHPEKYKSEDINLLLEKANMITPSILAGAATREAASKEVVESVAKIAGAALVGSALTMSAGLSAAPVLAAWLVNAAFHGKKNTGRRSSNDKD